MKALRTAVSGSRVRFTQDGFDLDLTYITPRLIAMGYPASGVEKTYRNDINQVASLLNARHPSAYRVYNLSERHYDYAKFEDRVSECGFPDHHPPPLQLLLDIMNDMIEWVAKSDKHVVVVHCLAGKGRTGVVCSCYLLLTGHYGSVFKLRKERELRELANSSIRDFWQARGQGVRFPSQALYIYYFIKVLRRQGRRPAQIPPLRPAKKMLLRSIVLNGVPDFEAQPRGGCTPFLQVLPAPSQHFKPQLLYNSSWHHPKFETYLADPLGSIMFEVNTEVQGDVTVRCFHANITNILGRHMVKMFHFTFHTDFFHNYSNQYRLPKAEVDEATGNQRYPENFEVVCNVTMLDPNQSAKPPRPSIVRSGSSNNLCNEIPEQAKVVYPPPMTQQRRMTLPSHQDMFDERRTRSQTSSQQDESTPNMQGWLYKQGGFVKNWKKRWFVAREGKMMYYHGNSDATPLGVVNLRRVTVETCDPHEVNARNKCLHFFKIIPPSAGQRTYFFGAESEQELVTWVNVVGAQSAYGIIYSAVPRRPQRSITIVTRASYEHEHQTPNGEAGQRCQPNTDGNENDRVSDARPSLLSTIAAAPRAAFDTLKGVRRPSQHQATDIPFHPPPREDTFWRDAVGMGPSAFTKAKERGSMMGRFFGDLRSLSFSDYDDHEKDQSPPASAVPKCVPAAPVADLTNTLSTREQASLLQEVSKYDTGIYVYSADELQEATRLQQYMRTTCGARSFSDGDPDCDPKSAVSVAYELKASPPGTLSHQLHYYVMQNRMGDAEQLLTELVLTKFPGLIDAMDHDPLAFTRLIASGDVALAGYEEQDGASYTAGNDFKGNHRAVFL